MNQETKIANTYLKIFAQCKIIKGYTRSLIYDLHRYNVYLVPNKLFDLVTIYENKKIPIDKLDKNERSYLKFLFEKEIAFLCKKGELSLFEDLNTSYENDSTSESMTIEAGIPGKHLNKIISLIEKLRTKHLGVIVTNKTGVDNLCKILDSIKQSRVETVQIYSNYQRDTFPKIIRLYKDNNRVIKIIIFDQESKYKYKGKFKNIVSVINSSISELHSPINKRCFNLSLEFFIESKSKNTYFNQKIHVSKELFIQNSIEHSKNRIWIKKLSVNEIAEKIETGDLTNIWNIPKTACQVCQDCEFRFMCQDNRLPILADDSSYYFSKECQYNPYICLWRGQPGYLNLSQTGITTGKNGVIYDAKRINSLVHKIWNSRLTL